MKRFLLRLATVLSALLLIAAVVVAIDSYGHKHQARVRFGNTWLEVRAQWASFQFVRISRTLDMSDQPRLEFYRHVNPDPPINYRIISKWYAFGFGYMDYTLDISSDSRRPMPDRFQGVIVPTWAMFLLLAILPAAHLVSWYRRRHLPDGPRCEKCGYNLTGTLAAAKTECPECGAPVAVAS